MRRGLRAGFDVETLPQRLQPPATTTTEPCLTLSPSLTLSSVDHTGLAGTGISMEALSDSTVIRLCSALMVSPDFDQQLDDGDFVEVARCRAP